MYICMCIYICIYMCVCMYIDIYIYVYIYLYTRIYIHVYNIYNTYIYIYTPYIYICIIWCEQYCMHIWLWVKTLLPSSWHQHKCDVHPKNTPDWHGFLQPAANRCHQVHMMAGLRGAVLKHIIQKGVFPQPNTWLHRALPQGNAEATSGYVGPQVAATGGIFLGLWSIPCFGSDSGRWYEPTIIRVRHLQIYKYIYMYIYIY